jgi:hypothetical protein
MAKTGKTERELLRVYVLPDGALDVRVLATWADDPTNEKAARLSKAVAAAIVGVLQGEASVPEFFRLNRPQ